MPIKETPRTPKLCELCGRPVTGRHGKAVLCLECVRDGKTIYSARRKRYKEDYLNGGAAYRDCESCATCEKLACRHNPKNPARLAG